MAFRCKIVTGELWAVAICLKRENPREMSKNKKKQERRNNFPKCGAGRYFLAILTATPITPAGSSFVGVHPFWSVFSAKCVREWGLVSCSGGKTWRTVRGRVLGSVLGRFSCKVCTENSDSILRLGDKTCGRGRGCVLGSVLGSFNCEVRARLGFGFSARR